MEKIKYIRNPTIDEMKNFNMVDYMLKDLTIGQIYEGQFHNFMGGDGYRLKKNMYDYPKELFKTEFEWQLEDIIND